MMIIEPKVRGFVCVTSHPEGCAAHVQQQIAHAREHPFTENGPRRVLVIGASTGYGLSSRIATAFGAKAATLGIFFERPANNGRPASAGYYNSIAFEEAARAEGLYASSINGDAFSDEIKAEAIARIREEMGQVDLVVYSLASPRRTDPKTGETYKSVLKPIGQRFTGKTVDTDKAVVGEVKIDPASEDEMAQTVKVMGGEDWDRWIEVLAEAGVLADGFLTTAYSYIGPEVTWPIYKNGTIGKAKDDLDNTAHRIRERFASLGSRAYVAVNKAVVTQASSAIPVVPLYISILFKVMKEAGTHEGCIEQMVRLFRNRFYHGDAIQTDADGRIHVDDLEMDPAIQQQVKEIWPVIDTDNLREISDFDGYQEDFLKLFGFGFPEVDYQREVEIDRTLPSG